MPDYVNYICPQFSRTHVNFQRVPTVDTSNPFVAKDVPSADESLVVIRFANPKGIDFPYLISVLHNSWMSRPNNIVVPGGQMGLAMQFIFTPMILRLMDLKKARRVGIEYSLIWRQHGPHFPSPAARPCRRTRLRRSGIQRQQSRADPSHHGGGGRKPEAR